MLVVFNLGFRPFFVLPVSAGKKLRSTTAITVGFALINLAAVLRGLLPSILPLWFSQLVLLSGLIWIAAFLMSAIVYAPILTEPRIDGQPG
jgi:uncharacterized protein involved in response to NO